MDPASLIEDKINSGELPNNLRENTYVKNWLFNGYTICNDKYKSYYQRENCINNTYKLIIPLHSRASTKMLISIKLDLGVLPKKLRHDECAKYWLYLEYDKCYNNSFNSSLVTQCITDADKNVIPILDKK